MKRSRFGIIVSRFNESITGKLLENCLRTLNEEGVENDRIQVVHVPGGFEIPWAVQEMALSGRFDAIIALGCVLKGQTPQNDYISQATYAHLQKISLETRVPCVTGILTPNNFKQAVARTKGEMDRGSEAALAALVMAEMKLGGTGRFLSVRHRDPSGTASVGRKR
ncbi:MAG: 6,7-dimethyl-8-ribityllumazine synthase [Elusimicrobia bacterium CG1_02_63_36]|nr:MAG: 6,7-dimethyl-8-ribityllumazine synthase [Elusimicrobia bacterium CG1_02_63_36]PIP83958.1 MAG: 6,7-dimethyl-8-ribityllumazine synthase [Elusimicrobia bacterium CG22_combo_CG10-13_8_21_14_all_63_91]PJA17255.1 MAG: 6,7-dimethyl-8-ribityllumazine synthase [Elusimicrobia bacterium CG_4_10_14_0_2_um_filter_63_34]PJB23864.1 MAG: 6,7-dimethyl-8-ribityllumazine synthase [Elusimicrobia bacterium CG_4_9_14_3_um_filter_62_55]